MGAGDDMTSLLTASSIKKLQDETPITAVFQPVLQVVGLKEISKGNSLRYRVLLSDGVYSTSSAMLGAHHTEMVQNNAISAQCLIKVTDYTVSSPNTGKKIICVTALTVIKTGEEVGRKLGDPQPLKTSDQPQQTNGGSGDAAPAAAPQNAALKETNSGTGFYGGRPQSNAGNQMQQKRPTQQGTPGTPGGGPMRIYPIASLTPYQNKWTIKGRVTQKSGVRTYSNSKGEGKFFNVVFADETGEIKGTAWKAECDLFFDQVELNKVYYVTKAQLKTANKQFSNTNNDYEMNFSSETRITPCDDGEAASVPAIQYKFVAIDQLASKDVASIIDVVGVVHNAGECTTIIAKASQREMTKRDLELVDDSCMVVRLTLWGDEAKKFPDQGGQILAVKGCKIGDWNGRSLGCLSSSQVMENPDCAEAHRLRGWYDTQGHSMSFKGYSSDGSSGGGGSQTRQWKTFDCIQSERLGMGDKPDYYTVKGFVAYIKKENCMYTACASDGCNKKVIDNGDGSYRCEKCNKTTNEFKFRLLLQMHLADGTGYHWATGFQDSAEKLLGKTAQEMGEMRENEDLFDFTIKSALFKPYQLTLRSKMESYNDDNRLKTVMVEVKDLDVAAYNKRLLADVRKMMSG